MTKSNAPRHSADDTHALPKEQLAAYGPPPPPPDLVDRIMANVEMAASRPESSSSRGRPARRSSITLMAFGAVAAAALAIIVMVFRSPPGTSTIGEEVVAAAPRRMALGDRAEALMETGAAIAYSLDHDGKCHVVQRRGEVRYQVRGGEEFVVETPAGRITVLGTQFSVEVEEMRATMRKKAAFGAAATLLVTVALYEGHLLFENEHGQLALAEGDIATAGLGEAPSLSSATEDEPVVDRPVSRVSRFKSSQARETLRRAIEAARQEDLRREATRDLSSESGEVAPEMPERPRGTLPREYIRETVGEITPLIAECYDTTLEQSPTAEGRVTVSFTIVGEEDVGGLVETAEIVEIDESLAELTDFDECIVQTILSIEIDPPEGGGEVNVTYPFIFHSSGDEETETLEESE